MFVKYLSLIAGRELSDFIYSDVYLRPPHSCLSIPFSQLSIYSLLTAVYIFPPHNCLSIPSSMMSICFLLTDVYLRLLTDNSTPSSQMSI